MSKFTIAAVEGNKLAFFDGRSIIVVFRTMINNISFNPHDKTITVNNGQLSVGSIPANLSDVISEIVSSSVPSQPPYRYNALDTFGPKGGLYIDSIQHKVDDYKPTSHMLTSAFGAAKIDVSMLDFATIESRDSDAASDEARLLHANAYSHHSLWYPDLYTANDAMEALFNTLTNNCADVLYQGNIN